MPQWDKKMLFIVKISLQVVAILVTQLTLLDLKIPLSSKKRDSLQFELSTEIKNRFWTELESGTEDNVIALLERNPLLIKERSTKNETPLHLASSRGVVRVVEWLLAKGAQVNVTTYNNFSPLCLTKKGIIARMLINAGARLDHRSSVGYTPLQVAAIGRHSEVVTEILATGYKLDLLSAIVIGDEIAVVRILRENPTNVDSPTEDGDDWPRQEYDTPLMIASKHGVKNIVQILLDAGANLNIVHTGGSIAGSLSCENKSALVYAISEGHIEVVKTLLQRGANVHINCGVIGSLIDYARKCRNPKPEIIRLLKLRAQKR